MARNCEKHFVRLNRVFLEEQWKKDKERQRPPLSKLNDADEVKKWIPSIKKELDYCLQQLSGARKHSYPDNKIKEFEDRVVTLEKEHRRFIMKAKQLDPSIAGIPWQPRGYTSKRKLHSDQVRCSSQPKSLKVKAIDTPILSTKEEERENPEDASDFVEKVNTDFHEETDIQKSQSFRESEGSSLVPYYSSDSDG